MKIVGYSALLYGRDYLHHAIRSIIDDVEEYIILYSPVGSHGHHTSTPCPETKDELYAIALEAAGDKLRWFDGHWPYEGAQRDSIFSIVPDADVIVVLDSDELWMPGLLKDAIAHGIRENVRQVRIPLQHYWRSFYKAFTHDPAAPARLHFPKFPQGETTFATNDESYRIQHLGYAITPSLMRYKWQVHGHLGEMRKDVDWLNDVYLANRQYDCHPVGSEYWMQAEDVIPSDFMHDHPFAKLSLIE
jgi:hypothetical protein